VTDLRLESRASSPWYSHITELTIKKKCKMIPAGGRRGELADQQKEPICEEREESDGGLTLTGIHCNCLAENRYTTSPDLSLLCKGSRARVLKPDDKREYKDTESQICLCHGFTAPGAMPSSFLILVSNHNGKYPLTPSVF